MARYVLALDQGTTSSRALLFDEHGKMVRMSNRPLPVRFPADGWVEQDPETIWETQREAAEEALGAAGNGTVVAIGVTNQRETTICWDPGTGEVLAPAIVWQCRRSEGICDRLRKAGWTEKIRQKTGLVVDAYFSLSKILWLLENVPQIRSRMKSGRVVFGTVDSWLIYRLTGGAGKGLCRTEPSNASRTSLFSLDSLDWDDELLELCTITRDNLAQVLPSDAELGMASIGGREIPIRAALGDQQASLFGHQGTAPGKVKCTFGTGAFLLAHAGTEAVRPDGGLLGTVGWTRLNGERSYAVEGAVFVAGAAIQWLRDGLGILQSSAESEDRARQVADSLGVVVIPAFVGLGAPWWKPSVRGAVFGLTRESNANHIVRATLEGVAHQVADLLEIPALASTRSLAIDGGMSANRLFSEILADLTRCEVRAAANAEVTAAGAAALAADAVGLCSSAKFLSSAAEVLVSMPGKSGAVSGIEAERAKWKRAVGLLTQSE